MCPYCTQKGQPPKESSQLGSAFAAISWEPCGDFHLENATPPLFMYPSHYPTTFPKTFQTQHNLLFCASEDLWGSEVYTSRQLQPTWKCLHRRLKSDKEAEQAERASQREPASPSAFPMFTSPQFGNAMFFNLQTPTFVLQYMIHWNIFSRTIALDLEHVGLDQTGQCFPAILRTEKLSITTCQQL